MRRDGATQRALASPFRARARQEQGIANLLPRSLPVLPSLVAILLIACCASGCGYSVGFRAPPGVYTIGVPIFHNSTFPLRREIEYVLTSEVRREIQTRTELRVVASEDADLVLRGHIVVFREVLVVEGEGDSKIDSNLHAVVRLVMEDSRNGFELRPEPVETVEPFSQAAGETFEDATQRALRDLAKRIVAAIEYWDDYDNEVEEEPL